MRRNAGAVVVDRNLNGPRAFDGSQRDAIRMGKRIGDEIGQAAPQGVEAHGMTRSPTV